MGETEKAKMEISISEKRRIPTHTESILRGVTGVLECRPSDEQRWRCSPSAGCEREMCTCFGHLHMHVHNRTPLGISQFPLLQQENTEPEDHGLVSGKWQKYTYAKT